MAKGSQTCAASPPTSTGDPCNALLTSKVMMRLFRAPGRAGQHTNFGPVQLTGRQSLMSLALIPSSGMLLV